jgi:TatD DNase family protein
MRVLLGKQEQLACAGRPPLKGVVHSFTGTAQEAEAILHAGFYIGINGCSLKTAENCAVAATIPLDRLLLETDSPWCGVKPTHASHAHVRTHWPAVKKDKYSPVTGGTLLVKDRNEPCTIVSVGEVLAGLIGVSVGEIARATTANAVTLFGPRIMHHAAQSDA